MQTNSLPTVLVAALLLVSASTGGTLAATVSPHAQQSPTGTPGTEANDTAMTAESGQSAPSITFNDQQLTDRSVSIRSVTLPQPGFVVIYNPSRAGNASNQIIGTFYLLGSGTTENFQVPLDIPINETTSLTAIVHTDSNNNGQFDYGSSNGSQDPALTPQGDRRVVDIAQITVRGGSASANTTEAGVSANEVATTASSSSSSGTNKTGTNASGGSNGSSSEFGPGFGLVIGIVALLTGVVLAARRS